MIYIFMCGEYTCGRQYLQGELAVFLVLVRVLLSHAPQLAALAPRQRRRGFGLLGCCCMPLTPALCVMEYKAKALQLQL